MIGPRSSIFQFLVRFAFFIINTFAAYLFFRGHNLPGGGFIAGLASAISLILLSLVAGPDSVVRMIRMDPVRLAAGGLFLALLSSTAPVAGGHTFLSQFNWHLHVPVLGELHVGTPMVFDLGVYLVVVGICCKIIFTLSRSAAGQAALTDTDQLRYGSAIEEPIDKPVCGKAEVTNVD